MNFQIIFNENANLKLKLYTEGQITLFFGHHLTVMFPSTKIRYPSKIWDSAKKAWFKPEVGLEYTGSRKKTWNLFAVELDIRQTFCNVTVKSLLKLHLRLNSILDRKSVV